MEKEFVPYEQALALKELGFNEPCFGEYRQWDGNKPNKPWLQLYQDLDGCSTDPADYEYTQEALAPTFSQAFRWFREKYEISYSIDWMTRDSKYYSGYYVHFRGINGNKLNRENFIVLNDELPPTEDAGYGVYRTYEEAELECLIKLIEIANKIKYSSSDVPTYYN